MDTSETLFVGVKGRVIALNRYDGAELWKTELQVGVTMGGQSFVTVLVDGDRVYAHTYGELFCLDAYTGEQLWSNELAGLGYGVATLTVAGESSSLLSALAEHQRKGGSAAAIAGAAALVAGL